MSNANSPKANAGMLLSNPLHHHHSTAMKLPTRHASPRLRGIGLAGASSTTMASTSSASSAIILDNQGEAHDPGYMLALREWQEKIGQEATETIVKRRRPSSASGSQHAPMRPSALGLGLSSNLAAIDLNNDSSSDDDDDEYSEDLDSYASLFEEARRHDAAIASRKRGQGISPVSTPNLALSSYATTSPSHLTRTSYTTAPRNTSFSSHADHDDDARSRRSSWSAKRATSPLRAATPHSAGQYASSGGAGSSLSQTQTQRDDWGFTGIVDVERERNNHLAAAAFADPGTPRHTAALLEEASHAPSAPNSPRLVAAASLHRTNVSPGFTTSYSELLGSSSGSHSNSIINKARQASFSHVGRSSSKPPLPKKTSLVELGKISPTNSVHSALEAAVAGRRKMSMSNNHGSPSSGGASTLHVHSPHGRASSLRQKLTGGSGSLVSSGKNRSPGSSGEAVYDSDHPVTSGMNTLQTIQSGRPMKSPVAQTSLPPTVGNGFASPSWSASPSSGLFSRSSNPHAGASAGSARRSLGSLTREQLEAELQQQHDEADFYVRPSRLKEGLDSVRRRGSEAADVAGHSYEFRRKMELFTMGVRFNAFKARRRLERGFKHHEA